LCFTNNEAFPVNVGLVFTIQEPSTLFSSVQNVIDLSEQPLSTRMTSLGPLTGNGRVNKVLKINLGEANGNSIEYFGNAVTYSTYYNGGVPYPMFFSLLATSNSNFSAGITISFRMKWTCRLWARRIVLDSGPTSKTIVQLLKEKQNELEALEGKIKDLGVDDNFDVAPLHDKRDLLLEFIDKLERMIHDPFLFIPKSELVLGNNPDSVGGGDTVSGESS
jgi:hypothetical protein